jgi:hypothetical protein
MTTHLPHAPSLAEILGWRLPDEKGYTSYGTKAGVGGVAGVGSRSTYVTSAIASLVVRKAGLHQLEAAW